ncbi:YebG family protein [Desulfoluna sp.]|uniref:YebG family protein n=1 Tax=Desulfoluna sp. TaxID=2045199 RepID=UPI00262D5073|nr:YebG family protein [Desulfoluna sp.]
MAVIVKFVVVRDGVEKMTFTTKKEADAYDKMLDIAENLHGFIGASGLDFPDEMLESLSLYLAENRDPLGAILKGSAPRLKAESAPEKVSDKPPKKAASSAKTPKKKA